MIFDFKLIVPAAMNVIKNVPVVNKNVLFLQFWAGTVGLNVNVAELKSSLRAWFYVFCFSFPFIAVLYFLGKNSF